MSADLLAATLPNLTPGMFDVRCCRRCHVMLSSDDRFVKRFRVYPGTEELENKHQIQSALMGVKSKEE
jgi:hypothetical protein